MASYGLKYYAEWRNYRKHDYRLEVLRRGYSGSATAMGDFAGCILEVQGNQGDIIAPIVKTQLRFTLIDTYDEPDTGSVKHGDWQEFYTPDAGLYKVVLKAWDSGAWVTEWSGYITPDSWAENLDYRSGVTITARDNIGHLQDFSFDMEPNSDGLVKISDLIDRSMEICELAMDYTIARSGLGPSSLNSIVADGVYLHDAYINASIFEDGNWYDALEKTLEAIGMALRYVGNNSVEITYLRNLPYMGNPYALAGYQELEFYGGTLELDPAVKEIVEEQDYGHESDVYFDVRGDLEFGSTETYRAKTEGNEMPSGGSYSRPEHDANINTVTDRGTSRWMAGSFLLDPSLYTPSSNLVRDEGQEGWKKYALVEANQISDSVQVAIFNMNTRTAAIKLVFQFTPTPLTLEYVGSTGASTNRIKNSGYSLSQIKYSVSRTGNGVKYWNGAAWVSTPQILTQDYDSQNEYATDLEIQLKETEGSYPGQIIVIFYQITYKCWSDVGNGAYARVAAVRAELNATTAVSSNTVKTISNADYNVRITRKPLFGALSVNVGFVTPDNYKKGIYYYKDGVLTLYPYRVRFDGQASGSEIPLPVLIHEQILCFYYGAARVLQGTCAPINKVRLDFHNRFRYKNTYYLLQGGSLDLFSGILTGAVFREYANFNDLWDGTTPTWSDDQGYNVAPSSGSGGGGSSSGGGGGGGGTTETDPVFSASPAAGISQSDINNWNGKTSNTGTVTSVTLTASTGISITDSGTAITTSGTRSISISDAYRTRINESYTGVQNLTTRVGDLETAVSELELEAGVSRKAPRIVIYRGFNKSEQTAFAPYLLAEHPAIGTVTDAEFVLMMLSPRRARRTGNKLCKDRKAWGAALGKTGEGGLTFTKQVTLLDLRTYILQNYVSVYGYTTTSMTYATYQSLRLATGFGFPTGTETLYRKKVKRSRVFGIAVRWTNPEFRELASGPLSDHTTEIYENGKYIPRWIYSDVAPIRVFAEISNLDGVASHNGGVIGFQLLP